MPYLHLKLSSHPTRHPAKDIASTLTDLTVEVLGKRRELTAVSLEYLTPDRWYIGGTNLGEQSLNSFNLDIKVTAGTNTKDAKAEFVSRAFAAIEVFMGPHAPESYVVVHEVHGEAWGFQGLTQEFRYGRGKAL